MWDEEQEREAKQKTDDQLANKANEELQGTILMRFWYYYPLRPCHTTTYSTNVCGRMKNSASTLVYAEYVTNKF